MRLERHGLRLALAVCALFLLTGGIAGVAAAARPTAARKNRDLLSETEAPTWWAPSRAPTLQPVQTLNAPSKTPSSAPLWPSPRPSQSPSSVPEATTVTSTPPRPSSAPSIAPVTEHPSNVPSKAPSSSPVWSSPRPSRSPSSAPTARTVTPTTPLPSRSPSSAPVTEHPSNGPSRSPSVAPVTQRPSNQPSARPTTSAPTNTPTGAPTTTSPSHSPITPTIDTYSAEYCYAFKGKDVCNNSGTCFWAGKFNECASKRGDCHLSTLQSGCVNFRGEFCIWSKSSCVPKGTPYVPPTASPTTVAPSQSPSAAPRAPTTAGPTASPATSSPSGSPSRTPSSSPTAPTLDTYSAAYCYAFKGKDVCNNSGTCSWAGKFNECVSKRGDCHLSTLQSGCVNFRGAYCIWSKSSCVPIGTPYVPPTASPTTVAPSRSPSAAPRAPSRSPSAAPRAPTTAGPTASPATSSPSGSPSRTPSSSPTAPTLDTYSAGYCYEFKGKDVCNNSGTCFWAGKFNECASKRGDCHLSTLQSGCVNFRGEFCIWSKSSCVPKGTPYQPPTFSPTAQPSKAPTLRPTGSPSTRPTESPSKSPTRTPSRSPSGSPTLRPSKAPTFTPSKSPTAPTTLSPSRSPVTQEPTMSPTTERPSASPSVSQPTTSPTTSEPTMSPTTSPTGSPTEVDVYSAAYCFNTYKAKAVCNQSGTCFWAGKFNQCVSRRGDCNLSTLKSGCNGARGAYCVWKSSSCVPIGTPYVPPTMSPTTASPTTQPSSAPTPFGFSHEANCFGFKTAVPCAATGTCYWSKAVQQCVTISGYCNIPTAKAGCIARPACKWIANKGCTPKYAPYVPPPTSSPTRSPTPPRPRSVILITYDDLRADVATKTYLDMNNMPNLKKFAKDAVTFNHAHTPYPLCNPSRVAIMTGRLPDVSEAYSLFADFRYSGFLSNSSDWKTLPQTFRESGYYTTFAGKLFHRPFDDIPLSWDNQTLENVNQGKGYYLGGCQSIPRKTRTDTGWKAFQYQSKGRPSPARGFQCRTSANVQLMDDFVVVNEALTKLSQIPPEQPFFMGIGLYRPHLPHHVHDIYWVNQYQNKLDSAKLDPYPLLGPTPTSAIRAEYFAWLDKTFPYVPISSNPWVATAPLTRRAVRMGYAAASLQVDAAFGKLIAGLETLGIAPSTAIVITADHGFALGEHGLWGKQTLVDVSTRVPLLVRVPWLTSGAQVSNHFVSSADVYRTVIDLFNLTSAAGDLSTSGSRSLVPILENVNVVSPEFPGYAFSQNARCAGQGNKGCDKLGSSMVAMGFSVRSLAWRYTEWFVWNKTTRYPNFDESLAVELYEAHKTDLTYATNVAREQQTFPERINVAAQNPVICGQLRAVLLQRFDRGPPPNGTIPEQPTEGEDDGTGEVIWPWEDPYYL